MFRNKSYYRKLLWTSIVINFLRVRPKSVTKGIVLFNNGFGYILYFCVRDNGGKKLPLKYYLLRCCSVLEMSISNYFNMQNGFYATLLKTSLNYFNFFFLINLTTNEAETSTGKLY